MTDAEGRIGAPKFQRGLPWLRQRIGIHLSTDVVRAVGVGARRLVWSLEGPGSSEAGGYSAAINGVLERIPQRPVLHLRPDVVVAVDADVVQVKSIFGLPPVADLRIATAMVREGAARFFRRTAEDLQTSTVHERADGSRWAAAYDGAVVREIANVFARHHVRLRGIVPAALVESETVAAASGAAHLPLSALAARLVAPTDGSVDTEVPPWRSRLAVGAALTSVLVAVTLPIIAAHTTARTSAAVHTQLRAQEVDALGTLEELRRVSVALAELAGRDAERRSGIELLAFLAATLPHGTALQHLQVDSTGGTLVVLTPSVDLVMKGLGERGALAAMEVVGPVTRERVGGRELERVSLRFRHRSVAGLESDR